MISVILPFACGSLSESTGNVDESLVLIAMSCATLLEAASYVIDDVKIIDALFEEKDTGGRKLPYFSHMGHQLHHMTSILRHIGLYFSKRPHMTKKLIMNNSKLSYMYMKKRHMGILLNSSIFSSVIWDHF